DVRKPLHAIAVPRGASARTCAKKPCTSRHCFVLGSAPQKSPGGRRTMTQLAANHGFGCACHPTMSYTPVSGRKLLAGAGALAAASALPTIARAQGKPKLIDTHHHFYAPDYQKAWMAWEDARKIPHFKTQVAWSREKAIEELDKNGVTTGILS